MLTTRFTASTRALSRGCLTSCLARVCSRSTAAAAARSVASGLSTRGVHTHVAPLLSAHAQTTIVQPLHHNAMANGHVLKFVETFREKGHIYAQLNPISANNNDRSVLHFQNFGLIPGHSYNVEGILSLPNGQTVATSEEIQAHLESVYCGMIGVETASVESVEERAWLNEQLEAHPFTASSFSTAERRNICSLLVQSEAFDHFMTLKFPTFKRYGLEGNESTMPALESILVAAQKAKMKNVVIGMPHRGRLNFLVSLLDYPARALFAKVKGQSLVPEGMDSWDDVISHVAQSVTKKYDPSLSNPLSVSLLHNPSHLEAVNPVSAGKARAKQDELDPAVARDQVLCLQLHGDAAFAGQGLCTETLNMAHLPDFDVGGTMHVIVNNQLGFTTGYPKSRSSRYSSDIMRIISAPVIHVNADNPEAVVYAARLCMEYRRIFKKDVLLDIIGFRKWGHNEVDEPAFTQPLMYKTIRSRKSIVENYKNQLLQENVITEDWLSKLKQRLTTYLEKELNEAANHKASKNEHFQNKWSTMVQPFNCLDEVQTGVDVSQLKTISKASVTLPPSFAVHPRLKKGHVDARLQVTESGKDIDWATAEAMAFGTLMAEGKNLRIAGQDVDRGTFSHRHTVLIDQNTAERYTPLLNAGLPGKIHSVNSHLAELAVMLYEFGYSWESPNTFNLWEAQFGDFNNGAQIAIDQFLTSSESKWLRQSALTLLLPHGYDGAGPEHSSSRVERFLQLSDDSEFKIHTKGDKNNINLIVVNCTTPAQYFHVLRRQLVRNYRKPLVIITPKTLLRHEKAVSNIEEMGPGTQFHSVLADTSLSAADASKVKTVVLLSGKSYYELVDRRNAAGRSDIAFIRVEELSPFPWEAVQAHIAPYTNASNFVWFQEEPANAGCWNWVMPRINKLLKSMGKNGEVQYVGRPPLASPAVGAAVYHKKEHEQMFKDLFAY